VSVLEEYLRTASLGIKREKSVCINDCRVRRFSMQLAIYLCYALLVESVSVNEMLMKCSYCRTFISRISYNVYQRYVLFQVPSRSAVHILRLSFCLPYTSRLFALCC
jgi:hypothetical protein